WFSPDGKYLVYYDAEDGNYYSYNFSTDAVVNLTQGMQVNWTVFTENESNYPLIKYLIHGIARFFDDSKSVLIYDRYDIYQIDLAGKKPPICLTNHYGAIHHISFRIAVPERDTLVSHHHALLLNAFNTDTKDNGFYRCRTDKQFEPEKLDMEPCRMLGTDQYSTPESLTKARDAEVYLVKRETASEFPNYFLTTDFKKYTPVTNYHPERKYNWLTS